jgi:uncharacterized coiled-coil protein SlyX
MTPPQNSIPTTLEEINDALTALQFNIDHIYHSAMEHFDLLTRRDNLKSEKAKLEAKLKE